MKKVDSKILKGLSENQISAVTHPLSPLLVIAGPGSGKTRVMAHRIPWLIQNYDLNPSNILAVTFTNKAAKELLNRTNIFINSSIKPLVKTFHGFASYFLRIEGNIIGLDQNFSIYDDDDQNKIIKNIFQELDIDPKKINVRIVNSEISRAKNNNLTPEKFASENSSYLDEIVSRVYTRYQETIENSNACDFDDLLMKTRNILSENNDIQSKWSDRFDQIIIDEFQDTNPLQFQISNLLIGENKSISVVGDPDQSIYSWRYANPTNLKEFEKQFKNCKVVNLDESYRSTQQILNAADSVIRKNTERFQRKLWTKKQNGSLIESNVYSDEESESLEIAYLISKQIKNGLSANEIAIMYRVNAQSRSFEVALSSLGLRYRLVGGVRFYDRREIKDILGYCKLILNPNDNSAFERVINIPSRGIGNKTLSILKNAAQIKNVSLLAFLLSYFSEENNDIKNKQSKNLFSARATQSFMTFIDIYINLCEGAKTLDPNNLISLILDTTDYAEYIKNDEDGTERLENIYELRSSAEEFSDSFSLDPNQNLIEFIEAASLNTNLEKLDDEFESITLITLHQAKGLEFQNVYMVGMEEGLLPHSKSLEMPEELEEERRLCYVGITRAKENLFLSYSKRRRFRGIYDNALKSRFLEDIPTEIINENNNYLYRNEMTRKVTNQNKSESSLKFGEQLDELARKISAKSDNAFSIGDRIDHEKYGSGIILDYKNLYKDVEITVKFKEPYGTKKIMNSRAPIKITTVKQSEDFENPEDYYGI